MLNTTTVFDFLNSGTCFLPTFAAKQCWTRSHFSYLSTPRPDYGLMLLVEGRMEFKTAGQMLVAKAGDVIFLPKNCFYDAIFHNETNAVSNYLVNFDVKNSTFFPKTPIMLFENAAALEDSFRQQIENKTRFADAPLQRIGRFYLFLDAISAYRKRIYSEHQDTLRTAQALLRDERDLSVQEIARLCCTSESSLRRLFKNALGISPVNYRIRARLDQAMYLFDATDLSVAEVAERLRFYDVAYFCKVFRTHVGVTPKQYTQNKKL